MEFAPRQSRVPELYGDYWLNSEPVSISALRGYVILLDFWDYTSSNSLRALPYVTEWHRKYQEYGLMVIGVHTPEFTFGREPDHVMQAVTDCGINYPVVMDNQAIILSAFAQRRKSCRCLIDKDGFMRFTQQGEGSYEEFERAIQVLLMDAGTRGELPELMEPVRDVDKVGAVCYRPSADVGMGYLRGTIGNTEGFSPESTVEHTDSGIHLPGRFYAQGIWTNDRECIRFSGDEPGYILASYEGQDVNGVLKIEEAKSGELIVEQDGLMLTEENRGDDVVLNEMGKSLLKIGGPRLYSVVKNKEFGAHTLTLRVSRKGIEFYSLSFTAGVIPQLISNN